jgi:hypothetical protein
MHGNCLRVLVSLVATDEQVEESLDVFDAAVDEALGVPVAVAATGALGALHRPPVEHTSA